MRYVRNPSGRIHSVTDEDAERLINSGEPYFEVTEEEYAPQRMQEEAALRAAQIEIDHEQRRPKVGPTQG